MTRKSRNDDAVAMMRAANPTSATELREAIDDTELSRAMQRAIAIGEHTVRTGSERGGAFSRHRGVSLGLGGLVFAAVVAALILLSGGSVNSVKNGAHPTFAAAAVKVAEANPRLLVTAPDWSIAHARSFEVDSGALIYKNDERPLYGPGGRQLNLNWYPARFYRLRMRENSQVRTRAGRVTPVALTLLGQRATTFAYAGQHPNYATILAPDGNVFVEISGSFGSKQEYEALLHSLRPVGVDAWLAAMPAEVLRPAARSAAIAQMLRDVPVPPGFDASALHFRVMPVQPGPDTSALKSESALTDRFMLAKSVTGAVACGWLQRWLSATRAGDGTAAREAVDAMSTARHWPVLLQMVREKGFRGNALPPHGQGWPSEILTAAREVADGYLRRKPTVRTIYVKGRPTGYLTPAGAAPASVMGCL